MTTQLPNVTVFDDDPDAFMDRQITDAAGANLTFTPLVAAGSGAFDITAAWQGTAAPTRVLRVPVATLAVGAHHLYLQIPGGNDIDLGWVEVLTRT